MGSIKLENLLGIDYIKKSADMNGKLANQDIYSIFTEFKLEPTINTNLDKSDKLSYSMFVDKKSEI